MSFTDYLEAKILDHILGATVFTAPATVYVGLSTTAINDDGTGVTEPVGGAYARVAVTNNVTNWPAAAGTPTTKSNGTAIAFAQATADWGTVTYFFVADAPTTGNVLMSGALSASKTIGTNDTASFAVGDLSATLD